MFVDLYLSPAFLVCYDGDDDGGNTPPDGGNTPPEAKTFTQDELNKILAEDKRKHQTQYQKLEKQLQDTLASAKLTTEERSKLEDSLEDVRKQLRTKDEQLKIEKKALEDQFQRQIAELTVRAEGAEKRFIDSTISRALLDAAVGGDSYNPQTVVTVLRPMVKMVDNAPMIDFPDVSAETGEPIIKQMTPSEAIERMKQLPDQYGNLFRSGVVGGLGGSSATGGLQPGSNGRVDVRKLTHEQYVELRKKNPAAIFGR